MCVSCVCDGVCASMHEGRYSCLRMRTPSADDATMRCGMHGVPVWAHIQMQNTHKESLASRSTVVIRSAVNMDCSADYDRWISFHRHVCVWVD